MKKIDPRKLDSFCRDERDFIYWAYEQYIRSYRRNEIFKEQINTILDIIKIKYNMGASVSKQDYREYKLDKLGI